MAAAGSTTEPVLLVSVGLGDQATVWDAAAPSLEAALYVQLAARLDSTTTVVVGATTELARHAQATAPLVITASPALVPALALPRYVLLAPPGNTCWAAVEQAMELALLVPGLAQAIH